MKVIIGKMAKAEIIAILVSFVAILLFEFIVFYYRPFSAVDAKLNKTAPTVILDAGHGGFDGGTSSQNGVLEKDINLKIALKLEGILSSLGYNVIMTRKSDSALSGDKKSDMYKRLDIINSHKDSLFISIHQNHFSEEKYFGAQVFYGSKNEEQSKNLADIIQQNLKNDINPENNRQIKKAYSSLFLFKKAEQPCVLIECGFLSNKNETELLINDKYQTKIAFCIAKSIFEFNNK